MIVGPSYFDERPAVPAAVLAFPRHPVRAWIVRPVDGPFWRGELFGGRDPADDGPNQTADGPLYLVLNALKAGPVRQGLPIVVAPDRALQSEAVA